MEVSNTDTWLQITFYVLVFTMTLISFHVILGWASKKLKEE